MTDRFDPQDPVHIKVEAGIELGGALFDIDDQQTVDNALRSVGFEVLETRDLSRQSGPSIPWYQPLVGSGISFASFRSSRFGRLVTHINLKALEAVRIAPRGTVRVSETLNLCATATAEAGRLGIFTPMYFSTPASRTSERRRAQFGRPPYAVRGHRPLMSSHECRMTLVDSFSGSRGVQKT